MKNTSGICSLCREHTDAKDSCCGYPVWVEGLMVHPDLFNEDQEEVER